MTLHLPDGLEYVYRIQRIEKVTDGDTLWLHLDVGFRQSMLVHIRLAHHDAPEMFRPRSEHELTMARRASGFVNDWISDRLDSGVYIQTAKDPGSFGRWLGDVFTADGQAMADEMVAEGLAVVWPERWRDKYDTAEPTRK